MSKVTVEEVKEFTLRLSNQEARDLRAVLKAVYGPVTVIELENQLENALEMMSQHCNAEYTYHIDCDGDLRVRRDNG